MPLIYLDQIADKKLKASSTDDAGTGLTSHIYSSSNASMKTAGGLTVEKRLAVGQFDGRLPLGAVISVSGTFGATNNGGSFTSPPGIPATGVVSDDGYMLCDGAQITDPSAVLSGFTPRINDDRFLQGSSMAGVVSVANTANLNNNTVALNSTTYLPAHNHGGGNHSHSYTYLTITAAVTSNNYAIAPNQYFIDTANSTSGSGNIITSQGNGTPFDIRPKWLSVLYLIRVR